MIRLYFVLSKLLSTIPREILIKITFLYLINIDYKITDLTLIQLSVIEIAGI